MCSLLPPQRSWGKVMFLHVSVILFTGRGVPGQVPPGRYPPPQTDTPPGQVPSRAGTTPRQVHTTTPGGYTPQGRYTLGRYTLQASNPPPPGAFQDTVNKRAVRILLECILVLISFLKYHQLKLICNKKSLCIDNISSDRILTCNSTAQFAERVQISSITRKPFCLLA